MWNKYRCPFEKTFDVTCALQGFCGMEPAEERFVEEIGREKCEEEEEEAEDETDSEDLEY